MKKWLSDIRKGSVKLSLLSLINERERYGYEIIRELKKRTDAALIIKEGNLYPALHKLESQNLVKSFWKEVEPGVPPRKYYKITKKGRENLDEMIKEWKKFTLSLNNLLKNEK